MLINVLTLPPPTILSHVFIQVMGPVTENWYFNTLQMFLRRNLNIFSFRMKLVTCRGANVNVAGI